MMKKIPKNVTLILTESDTIFHLSFPSSTVYKDSEEFLAAEEDNNLYEDLTSENGRHRKVSSVGVQTLLVLHKTRHTEPEKVKVKDNSTFVSNWEMYDTYNEYFCEQLKEEQIIDPKHANEDLSYHQLNQLIPQSSVIKEKQELEQLVLKNPNFVEAVMVIERLLASNSYSEEQKKFKGILETDKFQLDIQYRYRLEILWTFHNEYTKNRCVTAIAFNPVSEDMIAVGYGKYYFSDSVKTGVVMIWNIKNPRQPERERYFYFSVTSIEFSKNNPNLLAVGLYNGQIKILDASKDNFDVIREDTSSSFESAWTVLWFIEAKQEKLLACFGDGRVCKYEFATETYEMKRTEIMKTYKIEGPLKGIESLKMFEGNQVSSSRFAAAKCLTLHSADTYSYFLATNEGVIHRCYTNLFNKRIDLFKAHEGSVNCIKFSPFANKLFATCGEDFKVCIWTDGIKEPLITSRFSLEFVQDFDWSPSHSSIFITIRGYDILIWDLQRKIFCPESKTRSPTNSLNTVCKFTKSGNCLLVGDDAGNVHVFSVEDLPFPAFFQENLCLQSIKRILGTNLELLEKLEKLGGLNYAEGYFSK